MPWKKLVSIVVMVVVALAPVLAGKRIEPKPGSRRA